MGKNNTQKIIIKHLANALIYAAKKALREMTPAEREEAMRIFPAVGINLKTEGEQKNV